MLEKEVFVLNLEALSSTNEATTHSLLPPAMRGSTLQEEVKCSRCVKGTDFEEACGLSDSECCWPMTLPGKTPSGKTGP